MNEEKFRILRTLESLVAPGNRARLSPYIEAAQLNVLFGESPNPDCRQRDTRRILEQNTEQIDRLSKEWGRFRGNGANFHVAVYDETFLQTYLAYYFSTNIPKVQLVLLELAYHDLLPDNLTVVDVGVGTCTTFAAVIDFLLAWSTVCGLYDSPFPIETIRLHGIDANQTALDFSNRVLNALSDEIRKRPKHVAKETFSVLLDACDHCDWEKCDLEKSRPKLPASPILLCGSNLLNELTPDGKMRFRELLVNCGSETVAMVIEPGDKNATRCLNEWRRHVVSTTTDIRAIIPCGEENGFGEPPEVCASCWNARRENFHPSPLFKKFREAICRENPDTRSWDEYDNKLLSWSYSVLRKGNECPSDAIKTIQPQTRYIPGQLRYIGSFRRKRNNNEDPVSWEASPGGVRFRHDAYETLLKFCPATVSASECVLARPPGYAVPDLRHGEIVEVKGIRAENDEDNVAQLIIDEPENTTICPNRFSRSDCETGFLKSYSDRVRAAIDQIAFRLFGFPRMWNFQHRMLDRILKGRSLLGIAATGGGKSECYILPAMVLPGITVVVSPLKSLMKDQYEQRIGERFGLRDLCAYINSSVPMSERHTCLRQMEMGYYKLVLFTPEQLERGHILDSLERAHGQVGIRYLALDEAHCISQWGHDFRPSYLNIVKRLRERHIYPIRIAMTATASPRVRNELCEELSLQNAPIDNCGNVFVHSANRPELNFVVRQVGSSQERTEEIVHQLKTFLQRNESAEQPGSAIVFMPLTGGPPNHTAKVANRMEFGRLSAGVTRFAAYLENQLGTRVAIYHGQMSDNSENHTDDAQADCVLGDLSRRTRSREQQAFISGKRRVMVATKGFGMGIDKSDIRLIIHRTAPTNLESYVQEAGRAGRDGAMSDVMLFYSPDAPEDANDFEQSEHVKSDKAIQKHFIEDKYVRIKDVEILYGFLKHQRCVKDSNVVFTNDEVLQYLEEQGFRWPCFPPRQPTGRESVEHRGILDRGHLYGQKTTYIERVLAVMHKTRPRTNGKPTAFLKRYSRVAPVLKNVHVKKPDEIVRSTHYFGETFRNQQITSAELVTLLRQADDRGAGLLPLAERLHLSVAETCLLISDIKNLEGFFGSGNRWIPELLAYDVSFSLSRVSAVDYNCLSEWREYAGAKTRASRDEAYKRAKAKGRGNPSVDDWFSWSEVCHPVTWELVPGEAIDDDRKRDKHLDALSREIESRQQADWDAYDLLLKDYLGVSENASYSAADSGNCLRAIMLGYLETGEVVEGDDCGGCSRCRPDGDFEENLEKRKAIVHRLSPFAVSFLKRCKGYSDGIPSENETKRFWDDATAEEKRGRQVYRYVEGWCVKQLEQNRCHQSAMWLLLTGQANRSFSLDVHRFHKYARELLAVVPLKSEPFRRLIDQAVDVFDDESARLLKIKAEMHGRWNEHEEAIDAWQAVVASATLSSDADCVHAAYRKLYSYYRPGAMFDNADWVRSHGRDVARAMSNADQVLDVYRQLVPVLSYEQLSVELKFWCDCREEASDVVCGLFDLWLDDEDTTLDVSHIPQLISEGFWNMFSGDVRHRVLSRVSFPQVLGDSVLATEYLHSYLTQSSAVHLWPPPIELEACVKSMFGDPSREYEASQLHNRILNDCFRTAASMATYSYVLAKVNYLSYAEDVFQRASDSELRDACLVDALLIALNAEWQPAEHMQQFVGQQIFENQQWPIRDVLKQLPETVRSSVFDWLPAYVPTSFDGMCQWLRDIVLPSSELAPDVFARLVDRVSELGRRPNNQLFGMNRIVDLLWACFSKFPDSARSELVSHSLKKLCETVPSETTRWLKGLLDVNASDRDLVHVLSLLTGEQFDNPPDQRLAKLATLSRTLGCLHESSLINNVSRGPVLKLQHVCEIMHADGKVDSADHVISFLHLCRERDIYHTQEGFELLIHYLEKAKRYSEARDVVHMAQANGVIDEDTGESYLDLLCGDEERNPPEEQRLYRKLIQAICTEWPTC